MELDLITLNKRLKEKNDGANKNFDIEAPKTNELKKQTADEKLIVINGPQKQQEEKQNAVEESKIVEESEEEKFDEIGFLKFKHEKEIEDLKQYYEEQLALKVRNLFFTDYFFLFT